ncbi:MAG TPA: ankyrin repeat domain-containing protein [Terriglobia bacterium]|nr:ankyrin repeat domain-containing protein [Terriglobia bacterium]
MIQRKIAIAIVMLLTVVAGLSLAAGRSDVADAVMRGDAAAVRTLLQQKADVNAPQIDGATALHWAVYRDDLETAQLLLRAGARANVANRSGITPLAMACLYGNVNMINTLIAAGANAKELGPTGETTLMLAARNGNPEAIKVLIAAGADLNAKENLRNTTALMWAVEQKNSAAVKALLDAGADFRARTGPAGLPRNYMAARVDTAGVEAAVRRYADAAAAGRTYEEQVEFEEKNGIVHEGRRAAAQPARPAAAAVAANQPPPVVQADDTEVVIAGLVGSGGGGLTALVLAAREGDLQSAKFLLDAGADVNQVTEYGWTPLLTATNNRHYKLAMFLIERGADVNRANKGGWTPLYLATDNRNIEGGDFPVPKPDMDHLEYIKFLLDRGATPNARIKDNTLTRTIFTMQWFFESGATPFVRAAQSSDIELMKVLLAHGADPKAATDHGDTALTAAAGIGWVEGVTYEHSAKANLETIKMLLDLGLDPNGTNRDGRAPLMGAAMKGRNEVVQFLVDHGAKLETRDKGSRDSEDVGSKIAGHTWQALDYADGLVRVGVQSAIARADTAALIRKLMTERGLPVPPPNRVVDSICVVEICRERVVK